MAQYLRPIIAIDSPQSREAGLRDPWAEVSTSLSGDPAAKLGGSEQHVILDNETIRVHVDMQMRMEMFVGIVTLVLHSCCGHTRPAQKKKRKPQSERKGKPLTQTPVPGQERLIHLALP